jgi:hypothetical protein
MNSESLSPGNRVLRSTTRDALRAVADAPASGEEVEASAEDAGQPAEPPTPEAHAAVPQNTPEPANDNDAIEQSPAVNERGAQRMLPLR